MSTLTEPITVNVLTGFLGAGKTSLLNRLLRLPRLAGTAVIINEFGEVGLDHLLVETMDDDIVLLKSGCICCTIRGDLKDALLSLLERSRRGELPSFSRVAVETTGIADPAPIVATLSADPMLRHHFRIGNIVTVVDVPNGLSNLSAYPEALRQVAVADRLVISKTDLAQGDAEAALHARLSAINPTAEILPFSEDLRPDDAIFLHDVHDLAARGSEVARWLHAASSGGHHHHPHDVNSHRDIRAFVLTTDQPLHWPRFALWLSMLLNRHGERVLRLKGLLAIEGNDSPVVIQGVQHLIHKPVHLQRWPDGVSGTRIVVIARGLDEKSVQRSFSIFNGLRYEDNIDDEVTSA
ncbi:GTP-binding protein [Terrihabitans rhizophilus]|uniref:GTP-binding protein n=1 Tax=Terrihabitans rhizophilus TaxID=3092662 RepID=A0ABU4RM75_9HYPH|nr:GTP-binding protein [Terrihabitans sp. PJ23]MDX6805209.1 GTP-binding protein [Terrihabitans sp. PJ23]